MPNEVKLLPCPFCGDPLVIEAQTFGHMRDQSQLPEEQRCLLRHSAFPIEQAAAWNTRPTTVVTDEVVERMRDLSFALAAGGSEETDPAKLLDRIQWGVDHIQQVEAKRAADLVEELSRHPRTTWSQVKLAVLKRGGTVERTADDGRIFESAIASMPTVVTGEQT